MTGKKRKINSNKKTPEREAHKSVNERERVRRRFARNTQESARQSQRTRVELRYRRFFGNRDLSYDLGTPEAPTRDYNTFANVLDTPRVHGRELRANPNLGPRIRELTIPALDRLRRERLTSNPNMNYESEINTILDQSIRTARDETVGPNQGMSKNNNGQGAKRRKSKSKRKPPKKTKGKTKGKNKGKKKGKKNGKRSMRRKKSNYRKSKKR